MSASCSPRTIDPIAATPPSAVGPTPPPGNRTSAIVFAYNNAAGLRRLLPEVLATSVEEVIVMYGGTDDTRSVLDSFSDPRLMAVFEEERTGKWDAFNRGVGRATGDVVFLVSGDVQLGPDAFPRLLHRIVGGAGVAFPRVEPSNVHSWVTRVGARLWSLRDAQHAEATRLGLTVHGGELQAVRRELLETIPRSSTRMRGSACGPPSGGTRSSTSARPWSRTSFPRRSGTSSRSGPG